MNLFLGKPFYLKATNVPTYANRRDLRDWVSRFSGLQPKAMYLIRERTFERNPELSGKCSWILEYEKEVDVKSCLNKFKDFYDTRTPKMKTEPFYETQLFESVVGNLNFQ
jgi:hypothetical protein